MTSDVQKKARIKYDQTEKGKIVHARRNIRYDQSEKGKIVKARIYARRKRDLGYNSHNNRFDGCEGHHLNKTDVLFIPEELHQSIRHKQSDPASMKLINDAAFEWLCTQEVL